MRELSKLFGSPAKVKLLRLFCFNPDLVVDRDDVVKRLRISPDTATRELAALGRAGVLRKREFFKEYGTDAKGNPKKRRAAGWMLDARHPHLTPLRTFLADTLLPTGDEILKHLKGVGQLRLVVTSGLFLQNGESALDLLIVGEKIDVQALALSIRQLEAELGKELRYATLTSDDFAFRKRVQDRLVREVLDFPHECILDRLHAT